MCTPFRCPFASSSSSYTHTETPWSIELDVYNLRQPVRRAGQLLKQHLPIPKTTAQEQQKGDSSFHRPATGFPTCPQPLPHESSLRYLIGKPVKDFSSLSLLGRGNRKKPAAHVFPPSSNFPVWRCTHSMPWPNSRDLGKDLGPLGYNETRSAWSLHDLKNGSMTPSFWVRTPFWKGHGDSSWSGGVVFALVYLLQEPGVQIPKPIQTITVALNHRL